MVSCKWSRHLLNVNKCDNDIGIDRHSDAFKPCDLP